MDQDYEQILMMRRVTQMTGILHEFQCKQLSYWPIIFTHATKSSFSHDFENKTIIYTLKATEGKKPKDLKKRLEFLTKCTQELLGEDYSVVVKLRNKIIYTNKGVLDGRREESVTQDKRRSDKPRKRRVSKMAGKRTPARAPSRRS